jgi:hypothetical protein
VCPVLVAGWVLVGVCRLPEVWRMAGRVHADDQPEPEAEDEPECDAGAEHAEGVERRE